MDEKKKYSGIDLSKYNSGYQKSNDVIAAEQKKTDAENAVKNYGDFSFSQQGTYDSIMDKILNREKFSYDLNGDALYQQYKDKYIQQGKMAMQDTMGQASALTGGYGSSYASTVGNQAYQASLQNLNDVIPELYQLAYDKYNQEGQDLYNQYGMLSNEKQTEYGMWGDKYNRLATDRDYYGNEANNAYTKDYGQWSDQRTYDTNQYWSETEFGYGQERDAIADKQWQAQFDEAKRQYDEQMAFTKEQAEKSSSSGGSGGGGGGGTSNTLWYDTGTYDDKGNKIFRNSDGKTQAFGEGVNPYTGTKHKDAKYGTFSNGYQPNNIGGKKLSKAKDKNGLEMRTSVTGKEQTIWTVNGRYYLWRGDLNRYEEVDISEILGE